MPKVCSELLQWGCPNRYQGGRVETEQGKAGGFLGEERS